MGSRNRWPARSVAGLTAAATVAAVWLLGRGDADVGVAFVVVSFIVATGTTGAVLALRLPDHPVGKLLQLAAAAYALGSVAVAWIEAAVVDFRLPLSPVVIWAGDVLFGIGSSICATWLLLLFPTGRLPSPRWRPVAWTAGLALVAMLAGRLLGGEAFEGTPIDSPFTVEFDRSLLLVLEGGGFYLLAAIVLASVASLVVRYRSSQEVEREQLKWVALSASLVGIALLGTAVLEFANGTGELSDDVENITVTLALSLLPVSIGVAVLRYRLYEIDRLISRTVTYAVLTALLVGVYATIAVLPTVVLDVRSDVLVAAATLAAAAAFGPLRRRVQAVVDRRFNRSRYDAERTVASFAGLLRNQTDLATLTTDLVAVADGAVQPRHVHVWVRGGAVPR